MIVTKFLELSYLHDHDRSGVRDEQAEFGDTDDLDLCLYYLRTLSNVFRWAPDSIWAVLASRSVSPDTHPSLPSISKSINARPAFIRPNTEQLERTKTSTSRTSFCKYVSDASPTTRFLRMTS